MPRPYSFSLCFYFSFISIYNVSVFNILVNEDNPALDSIATAGIFHRKSSHMTHSTPQQLSLFITSSSERRKTVLDFRQMYSHQGSDNDCQENGMITVFRSCLFFTNGFLSPIVRKYNCEDRLADSKCVIASPSESRDWWTTARRRPLLN